MTTFQQLLPTVLLISISQRPAAAQQVSPSSDDYTAQSCFEFGLRGLYDAPLMGLPILAFLETTPALKRLRVTFEG